MRMVRPQIDAPQVTVAEDQQEFKPVTAARVRHPDFPGEGNTMLVCYRPSDDERRRLAAGEDIYLHLLMFGRPMTPHIVSVGAAETAAMYDRQVAP